MLVPIAFLLLLLAFSAVSRRLERSWLTAPMLFTFAGLAAGAALGPRQASPHGLEIFLALAEIGLSLTLFTDASRTDLRLLRRIRDLPARLLTIGMLLTLALGLGAAKLVFPSLTIWEAGALAAILAPTDAGLGLVIVNSPHVPLRIRQALNVEAGLNDGLAVPFLLCFIALATAGAEGGGDHMLLRFAVEQLGYGAALGGAIGLGGGLILGAAHRREWITPAFHRIGVVTLPLLCVLASPLIGASMFIAAFVAGLAVQLGDSTVGKHSVELTEDWGQVLNLAVFLLFGILAARAIPAFSPALLVYAALSLTIVRMLPVWVALRGTGLHPASACFMGWFGPRGLASIVLGLIYVEAELHTPGAATVHLAVVVTVLVSIVAHGASAGPGIARYARQVGRMEPSAPERA